MTFIVWPRRRRSRSTCARGQLIILESTTYPGTTDELVLPTLEEAGLKVGTRLLPGLLARARRSRQRAASQTRNIPKVVGGVTPRVHARSRARSTTQCVERVVPVSSTRVAEMVKLLENTFRSVNIGLVNELALMCDRARASTCGK